MTSTNTTATRAPEVEHSKTLKKINERLYLSTTARVWQAQDGEWRYKTFGRCQLATEGRTSRLDLALADVRQFG